MARQGEWEQRVAEWKRSGLTAKVFAARHGLNPGTLLWWSSKLQRTGARARADAAKFSFARVVPVDVAPARPAEPDQLLAIEAEPTTLGRSGGWGGVDVLQFLP